MTGAEETRVGVDIGGTFTDLVTVRDGRVDGLRRLREEAALRFDAVDFLAHGTTVATNAVLEGEWADTALVTTAGFRDALEIGRQARPDIYDFQVEKPARSTDRPVKTAKTPTLLSGVWNDSKRPRRGRRPERERR